MLYSSTYCQPTLVIGIFFILIIKTSIYGLQCGQSYNGSSDVNFTSPGWPSAYSINLDCQWTITARPKTYIKLVITDFDLQTAGCNDYLSIVQSNGDIFIGCGGKETAPLVFYTSGNYTLTFISDGVTSSSSRGFRAEVHVLQALCPPSHLSGLSGNFTSPNFPDHYPFNIECIYNITAPQGYRIELEFSVLNLEYHINCTEDYLLVETVAGWFQYCGKFLPPMPYMVSKGANMVVELVSNEKKVYQGFKAHYKAVPLIVTSTASPIQPTKTMSVTPSSTVVTPLPEIPDYLVGSFVTMKNHSIKGHTIEKLLTSSNIACVMLCQRNAKCKSVTYMTLHKSSGNCILHGTIGTPGSLEQRNDAVFYRIV